MPVHIIQPHSWTDWLGPFILTATAIVSFIFIQAAFRDSLRLYAHVELFEEYVNKLPNEIRNMTWEADVLTRRGSIRKIPRESENDASATPDTK